MALSKRTTGKTPSDSPTPAPRRRKAAAAETTEAPKTSRTRRKVTAAVTSEATDVVVQIVGPSSDESPRARSSSRSVLDSRATRSPIGSGRAAAPGHALLILDGPALALHSPVTRSWPSTIGEGGARRVVLASTSRFRSSA
jgi:hypothetical protein